MKCGIILIFCLNLYTTAHTQNADLSLDIPETTSLGNKNIFSFQVKAYTEAQLKEISGEKFAIPSCEIAYNGVDLKTKSCKTRGKTTLFFERKSYSISLKEPVELGGIKIKKLALNNLAMDRNYYRNRLSFLLMNKIGIFHLQNNFAELRINGDCAGLYLAIQKPEDYIQSKKSNLLVRREYSDHFVIEDSHGKNVKEQMKRLRSIPKLTRKYEGQQLYDSLNDLVYLDHYFQWLAFNYLIKNGDYTDELFLYLAKDENRFDIIPWDYDDIFMRQPHDGFEMRNKVLDHRLLFSGEEYLDIVIDNDSFLYLQFLHSFQLVLEILNPGVLKESFEEVYKELHPYFADQEIIALSEQDHYGLTDLSAFKVDLRSQFQTLLYQRKSIEMIIESELRRLLE